MTAHPRHAWIERSNAQTLYHIERQGRTSPGLVPFLGAGISTAFGFKDWKNLLLDAAPPNLAVLVASQLDALDYEGAAETILQEFGSDGFQNLVAASAGTSGLRPADFSVGTVSLLPLLAKGPVITTNFDRILEQAFVLNGTPFESVISGPRPDLIVDALHGNRRVLIKLHGDWQDRVGRTFARSDYDAHYGEAQPERKRELLAGAERLLFSSRSLLFIGASLGPDRTVSLLQEVQKAYAGIRHFAIMTAPPTAERFDEVERHLRTCGVLPLWYVADGADSHAAAVEALVLRIVERTSVRTIDGPTPEAAPRAAVRVTTPNRSNPDAVVALNAHLDRVVRLIEEGRLTLFLGSAVHHPTKLMAKEFYEELARIFECEALAEERFAVAQYIADRYGRDSLDAEIRKLFARTPLLPRETHDLLAGWKQYKTLAGDPVPYPLVFTTNYDDLLERCLYDADVPYHLLSYQAHGSDRGKFYHRDPDNGLRVIEQPQNIRTLSPDGLVLVKLNGGFDRQKRMPTSYATTRLDYWDLAAAVPNVLPNILQRKLSADPLLFLGHGLAAADIESLVRFAHKKHPGPRSWAVVLKTDGIEYWRQCGVEILSRPVHEYVDALRERLVGR